MKRLYKAVSVLMSLITVFSVFAIVPLEVSAAEGIEYIYRWWDSGAQEVKSETRICTDYTELNDRSSSYLGSSSSSVSWYVVKKDFWRPYYATHMQVTGTVNLIICDGVTFNAEAGVIVPENATLNIFGQSNGSGKIKIDLNVDKHREFTDRALIGGDSSANGNPNSGDINIYGGNLDLKTHGFSTAAMIGGAKGGSLNRFAMYGGTLTAVHSGNGAVIGGGNAAPASRYNGEGICFYGGTVDAKIADGSRGCGIGNGSGYSGTSPGSIAIYGGDIQATGKNGGAGIGGGQEAVNPAIDIYNGKVSASGIICYYTGAGIGSGQFANQNNPIRIHGGTVVATSQSGAGIGAGCGGNAGTIEISNTSVVSMATAGGAGIGGGKRAKDKGGYGGNITISSGSKVVATSSDYGEAQDLVNRLDGYIDHSGMKTDDTAYAGGIVSMVSFLIDLFDNDLSGTGIGGGYHGGAGTITISDSKVTAVSGSYAAAIGTGDEASGRCTINITDYSEVTANAGTDAAGIGTGNENDGAPTITISDSTVTSKGGAYGAGIGGGDAVSGGAINITSSNVKAYGGTDAAGIGGGEGGDGGLIEIRDSTVYAEGKSCGAGIGNGEDGYSTDIFIDYQSTVEAISGNKDASSIGHGDNGIFYGYSIKTAFGDCLLAEVGSDRNHSKLYTGNDIRNAVWNNPYAKIYPCDHENTIEWRCASAGYHVGYCTRCRSRLSEDYREHQWGEDHICTVCGASTETGTLTIIERNNDGPVTKEVPIYLYAEDTLPECTNVPDGYEFAYWILDVRYYSIPGGDVHYVGDHWLTAVYFPVVEASYISSDGTERTTKARRLTQAQLDDLYGSVLLTTGQYYIDSDITVNGTFYIQGDANLIVADGKTLTFSEYSSAAFSDNAFDTHIDYPESTLNIYGQTDQTGTINIQYFNTVFYNINQYGCVINIPYSAKCLNRFSAAKGGSLDIKLLEAAGGVSLTGGAVHINEIMNSGDILLGWSDMSDRIKIDAFTDCGAVKIAQSQSLTDGTNIYTGTLSGEQVSTMRGKTLTPYIAHHYGEPSWQWLDDYKNATAVFRCTDEGCADVQYADARVSYEDRDNIRTSTATCVFNGTTYTASHSTKILWDITITDSSYGTIAADKSTSRAYGRVDLTITPKSGYVLGYWSVTPADETQNVETYYTSFNMPESDVTVSADFSPVIPAREPYIDESGAYRLGNIEYVEVDGEPFSITEDGAIGEKLDDVTLSYFDFMLRSDDTYQITYYTGPKIDGELVIPKTFNGKPITVLGNNDNNRLYESGKTQFSLVLNENITEIRPYTFYVLYVTEVTGDTSGLNKIGNYAFSWANGPDDYKIDVKLDYEGMITVGSEIFNHDVVSLRIKHASKFSSASFSAQHVDYIFTDAHIYGNPAWSWADDHSSATATFTCTDSRCKHQETVDANVTSEKQTGKITYTATTEMNGRTYTDTKETGREYFVSHSLSLNGNIGVNFYLDLTDQEIADGAKVDFAWTVNGTEKTSSVTLSADDKYACGYKATCNVAVAEMTYDITATLSIGGEVIKTDTYSVKNYADTILTSDDFRTKYIAEKGEEKYDQLVTLVKAMLDYGSKAQLTFDRNTDALANGGTDYFTDTVNASDIASTMSNMTENLSSYGLEYTGTTIVYLTETSIRHYYTITDQDAFDLVKDNITFDGVKVGYTKKGNEIYFEKKGVAAADLDVAYTFSIGTNSYDYAVLDYVKRCLESDKVKPETKELVAATYRYNQAANTYFGR